VRLRHGKKNMRRGVINPKASAIGRIMVHAVPWKNLAEEKKVGMLRMETPKNGVGEGTGKVVGPKFGGRRRELFSMKKDVEQRGIKERRNSNRL